MKMSPGRSPPPLVPPPLLLLLCGLLLALSAAESQGKPGRKKDIRDYNDADMARLLEQWEVGSPGALPCTHPLRVRLRVRVRARSLSGLHTVSLACTHAASLVS